VSVVQVAFPVLRGKRRFKIEKGRRWSIVEHLLLQAVSEKPASAEALEKAACLPRRVVVEAFVRLMRASWVEMISTRGGTEFEATPLGRIQAKADDLPAFPLVPAGAASLAGLQHRSGDGHRVPGPGAAAGSSE
jgi:cardiolipin synthase A/B